MDVSVGSVPLIHFIVIYANAVLACIFNSILLILIKTTVTRIGRYSMLLSVMAVFNMCYAVIHVLDAPLVVVKDHLLIFSSTGIFEKNFTIGYPLTIVYCSLFGQSVMLLMYHFIYRYIAVCRHHLMLRLHQPRTILLCVVAYILSAIIWAELVINLLQTEEVKELMSDLLMREYGINSTVTGLVGVGYMYDTAAGYKVNIRPWLGGLLACFIMGISFSVMALCAVSIQRKLRESQASFTQKSHQLQVQLFRALIVQTVVPLIVEFSPSFLIFVLPMTGIPISAEFTTLSISAYPVVEPLVVIYFVRDYRVALAKKLGLVKTTEVTPSASHTAVAASWSVLTQQTFTGIRERFFSLPMNSL